MTTKSQNRIAKLATAWVTFVTSHPQIVLLLTAALIAIAAVFTINNIGISTNTSDMLSEKLAWRQTAIKYENEFPQFFDNFLVVIEASNESDAAKAQSKLYDAVKYDPNFTQVLLTDGGDFFRKYSLQFLQDDDFKNLQQNLVAMQPFLQPLLQNPTISQFLLGVQYTVGNDNTVDDSPQFNQMLKQLNNSIAAANAKKPYQFAWSEVLFNKENGHSIKTIILKPKLEYDNFLPAENAFKELQQIITNLQLESKYNVSIGVTGEAALAHEEFEVVNKGATISGLMALVMVGIVLIISLGSSYVVLASLVTLIAGLLLTAGFAALAVGHLNVISVAFAVLYIGLGIDFSIHYCFRVQELAKHHGKVQAIRLAAGDVGTSLVICSLTTAIGFFSFLPTSFNGVSELGLISGTGMLISLVANLTVLPALLCFASHKALVKTQQRKFLPQLVLNKITNFPFNYRLVILYVTLLVAGLSIYLLPQTKFIADPMRLRPEASQSVVTFNKLISSPDVSPLSLTVLTTSLQQAEAIRNELDKLPLVKRTIMLQDFVPILSAEKKQQIDKLVNNFIVSPAPEVNIKQDIKTLDDFAAAINKLAANTENEDILNLKDSLDIYIPNLKILTKQQQHQQLQQLQQDIIAPLTDEIKFLLAVTNKQELSVSNLPIFISQSWKSLDNGYYRIEVIPGPEIDSLDAAKEFVNQVITVAPNVTGLPVIHIKAGKAVVKAFEQAFSYAFVAILLLLFLMFHRLYDVILILTPMLLVMVTTSAASIIFDINFNFANIIALPLLLGIGVDNGIHLVKRFHHLRGGENILQTSTSRGVVASSITTICGFGNLAFSPHPGMASMGQILTIGMLITLYATLIFLPALLNKKQTAFR